ncbi:MAG: PAS domain S-box protein [Actinomycetota bacterium]|nr:PAS domain S-box protein [Actinomycetota bacterium]
MGILIEMGTMDAERADEQIKRELDELRRRVAELEAADVTQKEQQIPAPESDYFRRLIENLHDLVLIIDADFSIQYVSPSAKRMTGYEPGEVVGMNAFDFVHPDDIPAITDTFTTGIQEPGRVERLEYRMRCKDGSWIVAGGTAVNLLNDPAVGAVVVNLHDVSEYRRIEKELQESEERYRFLVENLNDVVFAVDLQGMLLYISPAIERVSQYSAQDLEGNPFMRFIHPEDLPGLLQSFQKTLAGNLEPYEFRVIDKDGSLFHVRTSSRPFEENGQVVGLIGIISEITERIQADEARKRSEEHFRAMIRKNIHYYRGSS